MPPSEEVGESARGGQRNNPADLRIRKNVYFDDRRCFIFAFFWGIPRKKPCRHRAPMPMRGASTDRQGAARPTHTLYHTFSSSLPHRADVSHVGGTPCAPARVGAVKVSDRDTPFSSPVGYLRGAVLAVPPRPAAFCFQAMDINDDADIRAFWNDLQRTTGSRSSSWDTFAATFEVGSMRRKVAGRRTANRECVQEMLYIASGTGYTLRGCGLTNFFSRSTHYP